MKTSYKIVWIDDAQSRIRGEKRDIRNFLDKNGVQLQLIELEPNASEEITSTQGFKDAFNQDVDFLFVDFNMPGLSGDQIINFVRKELRNYYLPIVFYTNDDFKDLVKKISEANSNSSNEDILDGIYFCHKDHLILRVIRILESLIEKDHKINSVRGMVIEKVSYIDVQIQSGIEKLYSLVEADKQKKIVDLVGKKFKRRKDLLVQACELVEENDYEKILKEIIGNPKLTDTHFRADVLRNILRQISELSDKGGVLSDFYNSKDGVKCLNELRNLYAHQSEDDLTDLHSDENSIHIKKEAIRHTSNVDEIVAS